MPLNLKSASLATALFLTLNPNFTAISNLFQGLNNDRTLTTSAFAQPRPRKDFVRVKDKVYSLKEDPKEAGKFQVYDNLGSVADDNSAQKAIFSRLVYDEYTSKISELPWKPLYTAYFQVGTLAQHSKNTLGFILFGSYKHLADVPSLDKGGLLSLVIKLKKEQILETAQHNVKNPEAFYKETAIQTYKEGLRAWEDNISVLNSIKGGRLLSNEEADRFLYNWFLANTLMPAANQLTTDIVSKRYNLNIETTAANTIFALLGRNLEKLDKDNVLEETIKALADSLGQYDPYKKFIRTVEDGIKAYIKKKMTLDERAIQLIARAIPAIKTGASRVVFESDNKVYMVDISRRHVYKLIDSSVSPSISPDGRLAVIASDLSRISVEAYLMSTENRKMTKLTDIPLPYKGVTNPVFSKDGKRIVFRRFGNLYLMNLYGDECNKLLVKHKPENPVLLSRISFSPDGNKIVYSTHEGLWIMNSDGSNPHKIAGSGVFAKTPEWDHFSSPDWSVNDKIVVERNSKKEEEKYAHESLLIMASDGSIVKKLDPKYDNTPINPGAIRYPTWSSDGRFLFFEMGLARSPNALYLMNPETEEIIDIRTFNWTTTKEPLKPSTLEEVLGRKIVNVEYRTPESAVMAWFDAFKKGDLDKFYKIDCSDSIGVDSYVREHSRIKAAERYRKELDGVEIKVRVPSSLKTRMVDDEKKPFIPPRYVGQGVFEYVIVNADATTGGRITFELIKLGNGWRVLNVSNR